MINRDVTVHWFPGRLIGTMILVLEDGWRFDLGSVRDPWNGCRHHVGELMTSAERAIDREPGAVQYWIKRTEAACSIET